MNSTVLITSATRMVKIAALLSLLIPSGVALTQAGESVIGEYPQKDHGKGTLDGSPLDNLPAHIRKIADFGMRPVWSPDQKQLAFIDAPLGQIHIADLASGEIRNISKDIPNFGFLRVHYLTNGDLLVCAPARKPPDSEAGPGRFEGVLSVLRKPFTGELQPLGPSCWEGIATSRHSMRIGWNRSDVRFDQEVNPETFYSDIWTGEVGYDASGKAYLSDVKKVLDRSAIPYSAVLEFQDFRDPKDEELILTVYGQSAVDVFGYDTASNMLKNYSNSSAYEEAENVAPDGNWVLVERNIESANRPGALDIWRLSLKDNSWQRLTYFNRYRGETHPYYASNPVISPKGDKMAFQLSIDGPTEGEGSGILIMDLGAVATD